MRTTTTSLNVVAAALLLALTGCMAKPPEVPSALHPPAGEVLYMTAYGSGTQNYECNVKSGAPNEFEWTLTGPDALLKDRTGNLIGWHYVGPTWKSIDGSSVVGEVRARDPGPDPGAIPWLLLATDAGPQAGAFSAATSVQRLQTKGGVAPKDGCNDANRKHVVQVPYSATYYFYRRS